MKWCVHKTILNQKRFKCEQNVSEITCAGDVCMCTRTCEWFRTHKSCCQNPLTYCASVFVFFFCWFVVRRVKWQKINKRAKIDWIRSNVNRVTIISNRPRATKFNVLVPRLFFVLLRFLHMPFKLIDSINYLSVEYHVSRIVLNLNCNKNTAHGERYMRLCLLKRFNVYNGNATEKRNDMS